MCKCKTVQCIIGLPFLWKMLEQGHAVWLTGLVRGLQEDLRCCSLVPGTVTVLSCEEEDQPSNSSLTLPKFEQMKTLSRLKDRGSCEKFMRNSFHHEKFMVKEILKEALNTFLEFYSGLA